MPNSLSSKKRLRQSIDRRLRNRSAKAALRTQIRKLRIAIQGSDVEASQKEYILVTKKLDQAASKKIIHDNQASRLKSRLSAAIKKIKAAKASA
jgi:small subunit ribosomal protein S20